jgi:hypothetical protein
MSKHNFKFQTNDLNTFIHTTFLITTKTADEFKMQGLSVKDSENSKPQNI